MDVNQDIKFIVKLKNKQNKSRGGGGVRGGRGGGAGRCEPRIEVIVKLKSRGVVG